MAFRRGPPEDSPVIRAPPMKPPPGHPPPVGPRKTAHFDDQLAYLESPPRGGLPPSPRRFVGDSPPYRYSDEAPRRYSVGGHFSRPLSEDAPPGAHRTYHSESESPSPPPGYFRPPPPPGGFVYESPRRFGRSPRQFRRYPSPGNAEDQTRTFTGSPHQFRDDSPPRYADEAPKRFGGSPRRDSPPSPPGGGPRGDSSPPPTFQGGALPPRQFTAASPPGPQDAPGPLGPSGYKENLLGRLGAEPRQFAAAAVAGAAGAGLAGYAEDITERKGPGGPPPEPVTPGFGPPPSQFHDGLPPGPPGYMDIATLLPQQPESFPPGAPPPGADPGLPRFPPDVFAGAPARRPSPRRGFLAGSSHPGLITSSGADPVLLKTRDGSPPSTFGGPRGPLGSTSPRYKGLGDRFEPSPDIYGALPPPPGLGQRGDAPRLGAPPGYDTTQRVPLGAGELVVAGPGGSPPVPEFLFYRPQKKQPSGYKARSPREPPQRRPGLEHDAIFTADVMPIELDEKLKEVAPHRGNPGSSTGGAWTDVWAGLFFLLQIGGITALCIIFGLQGLTHTIQHYRDPNTFHIDDWLPQLGSAAITGAAFAIIWQNAIRMAPVPMILVTIWTGSALMVLVGIVLLATGESTGLIGIAFFFTGLCQALYAFVVRERIPFAGVMLKKVISVCNAHPSTYGVSYSCLLVSLGWVAIWIFGFSGSGIRPRHALIMAVLVASLVWTMQVFRNIVRVTVAGTVGLFYFQEKNMPLMTTPIALLRACTTSLGSICFGSLLVPLVEAPCHALRRINSHAGASEFLFSCVVCFLAVYENLIRYFNKLGYIQVAIYGKPFLRASKDTWDMLRAQKVNVLVDDDLISTILMLACGIGGSLSALVGGIYTFLAHKSLTITITIVSFLIGSLLTYIAMAIVESAVATYYVCFAEDPDSLQRYDGPFYERMWVRQMELAELGD